MDAWGLRARFDPEVGSPLGRFFAPLTLWWPGCFDWIFGLVFWGLGSFKNRGHWGGPTYVIEKQLQKNWTLHLPGQKFGLQEWRVSWSKSLNKTSTEVFSFGKLKWENTHQVIKILKKSWSLFAPGPRVPARKLSHEILRGIFGLFRQFSCQ